MITLTSAIRAFSVTFTPSSELDVVGYVIHAAPASVFVNGDFQPTEATLINKGVESSFYYTLTDEQPSGVWGVKIAAYDTFGDDLLNYSTVQLVTVKEYDVNDTTPPDVPVWDTSSSSIEGSGELLTSSITLSWILHNKPADFLQYSLRYRRQAASVWTEVTTKSSSYTVGGLISGDTYVFQVCSQDRAGNASVWTDLLPVYAVRDTGIPTTPPSFTATILDRWISFNWAVSPDKDIAGYYLRVGTTWETSLEVAKVGSNTTSYLWSPNKTGSMQFWICAIDYSMNMSVPRKAPFVLTIAKPWFTSGATIQAEVVDNNVLLRWPVATVGSYPIDHYVIKKGLDYSSAESVGTKSGTFTTVFETKSGTYKYWIAPVDSAGMEGDPISVYAQVNQPPDFTLHNSYNSDFSGTKVNCYVENGHLITPVNPTETFAQHFTNHSWTHPSDQVNAGYPVYSQPGTASGSYTEIKDYGKSLSSKVVLNITKTTAVGTVTVTPTISTSTDGQEWVDYPGVYEVFSTGFRFLKFRLDFSTSDNGILNISSCGVSLADKAKSMEGTVYVTTSGTDVYMTSDGTAEGTRQFLAANSIQLTPQGTQPRIAIYDFVAIPDPLSFKVYLYNMQGNPVAGWVSWLVRGV